MTKRCPRCSSRWVSLTVVVVLPEQLGPVIHTTRSRWLALRRARILAAAKILARLNARHLLRVVWITGPSCSGKTTTTVKLTQRLEHLGQRFVMLNLDDYF